MASRRKGLGTGPCRAEARSSRGREKRQARKVKEARNKHGGPGGAMRGRQSRQGPRAKGTLEAVSTVGAGTPSSLPHSGFSSLLLPACPVCRGAQLACTPRSSEPAGSPRGQLRGWVSASGAGWGGTALGRSGPLGPGPWGRQGTARPLPCPLGALPGPSRAAYLTAGQRFYPFPEIKLPHFSLSNSELVSSPPCRHSFTALRLILGVCKRRILASPLYLSELITSPSQITPGQY